MDTRAWHELARVASQEGIAAQAGHQSGWAQRCGPNGKPLGREVVALFQHDAQTKGAEQVFC